MSVEKGAQGGKAGAHNGGAEFGNRPYPGIDVDPCTNISEQCMQVEGEKHSQGTLRLVMSGTE